MSVRTVYGALFLMIPFSAFGQGLVETVGPPKPVEVINDSLTIEGTVNATLDEPVEVEGVVGVDILSAPDDAVSIDSFVSAAFWGSVWGLDPTRDVVTSFDGVLQSVQVQHQVNGTLLRDSGDPAFFARDVSCTLRIFAVKDGQQRELFRSQIIQSNDSGASGVVKIPDLDLRGGGGAIRTLLEGPPDNEFDDIPGGSPVCFVSWAALGTQ